MYNSQSALHIPGSTFMDSPSHGSHRTTDVFNEKHPHMRTRAVQANVVQGSAVQCAIILSIRPRCLSLTLEFWGSAPSHLFTPFSTCFPTGILPCSSCKQHNLLSRLCRSICLESRPYFFTWLSLPGSLRLGSASPLPSRPS